MKSLTKEVLDLVDEEQIVTPHGVQIQGVMMSNLLLCIMGIFLSKNLRTMT